MILGVILEDPDCDESLSLTPKRAPVSKPDPDGRGGGASLGREGLGDGGLDDAPFDWAVPFFAGAGGFPIVDAGVVVAWSVSTSIATGSCFWVDGFCSGC